MVDRRRRGVIGVVVVALAACAALPAGAVPATPSPAATLLGALPAQYRLAVVVHDVQLAAQLRSEVRLLAVLPQSAAGRVALARLGSVLAATTHALQPWATLPAVQVLAQRARPATGARGVSPSPRPYAAIRSDLGAATSATSRARAVAAALRAFAGSGALVERLGSGSTALTDAFWSPSRARPGLLVALDRRLAPGSVSAAADRVRDALSSAEQSLGDVHVSRATVVADAAILVFREGLEAVLILAAITASFTGARRALRRPVLVGGLIGIVASVITWLIAQLVIAELGTGGLRLEAITGVLAIVVLLVVTNWFFHRVYWSQWIARFNRRRKHLEKVDRLGFLSGQVVGLVLLGLTSVYREGFETVLFLQNLQVSAGTGACLLGAGIGLVGALAIGALTFAAQRKLPYRKMLIATGVLIAVVLAVMTGTTVHVMQGLGWIPATPTGFTLPIWANSWLGLFATWQGLAAQLGALAIVLGSYVAAREIQVRRPQRRARRAGYVAGPDTAAAP